MLRHILPLVSAGLLLALSAGAQNAPSSMPAPGSAAPGMQGGPMQGGPGGGQRPPYKPRNLKVLPADTDLDKVMHAYTGALGVQCGFCHAPNDPVTHRPDRASDANPMKDQARIMIRMTEELNKKWLPSLAKMPGHDDHDEQAVIGCGTCHRGEKHPPAFVPAPRPEGPRPPGTPGAAPAAPPPPTAPS